MNAENLGTAVRVARRRLGLRQDELAAAAGVGVRFVVELEAGKPTIQLGKAIQVLDVLGQTLTVGER